MRFLVLFAVLIASAFAGDQNLESKLITSLLKNYDARVRPVKSYATAVPLQFGLGLSNIDAGQNNFFSFNCWTKMYWMDEYLQWTPAEHGNVKTLKIHPFIFGEDPKIWTPDIGLYGGKTERADVATQRAFIQNTGNVTYFQLRIYKVPCYPVAGATGKMICKLHFASWVYPKSEIDVQLIDTQIETFVDAKSVWKLAEQKVEKTEKTFESVPGAFWPNIEISLTLQKSEA